MRLGLVAYSDNTGLGNQTHAYYRHLQPARVLLIDRSGNKVEHAFHPERYPDADIIVKGLPDYGQTELFLAGLDVVLMAECSPTQHLLRRAQELGVKTVIVPNWEYFHNLKKTRLLLPDLLLAPSLWHFDEYPGEKKYLPFPIEVSRPVGKDVDTGYNFMHVAGLPIAPDRNGTLTVLQALEHVTARIKMTIFCQKPGYIDELIAQNGIKVPENVQLLQVTSVKNTAELYEGQHVLLMPRRFGGLCLPVNEALGYGLPVIMPDISPNNRWLPGSLLIPARKIDERKMGNQIDIYEADPQALASLVDQIRNGRALYWRLRQQVKQLQEAYGWHTLKPEYIETLSTVV